jgi:hypothetical protein
MLGWLSAAGCGLPLTRAEAPRAFSNANPSARSACIRSAQLRNAMTDVDATPQSAAAPQPTHGASGFFRARSRMARRTEAEQPDWLSPIATTSGRLKDEFRFDVWRPISTSGQPDYTFGGGKGLEFIVAPRVQLQIGLSSYLEYPHNESRDGFGDMPLMLKFRVASAPRKKGDYLFTLLLKATAPTGSNATGMHAAVLTPGIALGKGWKQFDVQSTLGSTFPTGDTARIGRQFLWDTTLQYRARRKLWPELEVNSTHYLTDKYAGQTQSFLTPGLGFGRVHLCGPLSFSAGVGFQIAVTEFHTYNHQLMLSFRFPF